MDSRQTLGRASIWVRLRGVVGVAMVCALAACGGGGGDDSPHATVTVEAGSVNLPNAYVDDQPPPAKTVSVTVQGHGVAEVGAAFDPAYPVAEWLGGGMTGSGENYQLSLQVAGYAPIGENVAHLLVGAVDKDGNLLDSKTLEVHYIVIDRLTPSSSALAFTGVNGNAPPNAQDVVINGVGLNWTAEANASWVHVDRAAGQGGETLSVSADPTELASGHHAAAITLRAGDGQVVELPVTFDLSSPDVSLSPSQLTFGGTSGHDSSLQSTELTLGVNSQAYAWRIVSLPDWLSADKTSGSVDSTGQVIEFTPDLTKAPVGVTNASVRFEIVVNGDTLQQQMPVTVRQDRHRLLVSSYGVAFTSVPGWNRVSKTLKVSENLGRAVPWTATADKAWLTVTGSGIAGGSLVLQADPSAVATDALDIATVTIQSSDPLVTRAVTVKVGLWKGSSKLSSTLTKAGAAYSELANDPIRPYVYAHHRGSSIDIYHVHTGNKVGTIANAATSSGAMSISADGQSMYVVDEGFKRISVISLTSRTKVRTITAVNPTPTGISLKVVRTGGFDVLVMGDWTAYRGVDGMPLSRVSPGIGYDDGQASIAATPDGSRLYYIGRNSSPASTSGFKLDYTELGGGAMVSTDLGSQWNVGSNGQDIAVSADGHTLYTASGSPYQFITSNGDDLSVIGNLPGGDAYPDNIEVASDGRVAGGISGWYSASDIWLYSAGGALLHTYKVAGYAKELTPRQLVFSGDALTLVTQTDDPKLVFIPIGP